MLFLQVVVCEREVQDLSMQQFLLEGAVAGGWTPLTAGGAHEAADGGFVLVEWGIILSQ